mmetsp:Transcript_65899/g.123009  ORF Transcript_65899/g.123009 Transcript_65899/m.123009 type:complete len:253 (-) Transcript_65899:446-1204(-)
MFCCCTGHNDGKVIEEGDYVLHQPVESSVALRDNEIQEDVAIPANSADNDPPVKESTIEGLKEYTPVDDVKDDIKEDADRSIETKDTSSPQQANSGNQSAVAKDESEFSFRDGSLTAASEMASLDNAPPGNEGNKQVTKGVSFAMAPGPQRVVVTLHPQAGKVLGADLTFGAGSDIGLVRVKGLKEGGMLAEWNKEHPDQEVMAGHFIESMNGQETATLAQVEMLKMLKAEKVELAFVRVKPASKKDVDNRN